MLARQADTGIDIANNGEQVRESFFSYVRWRMTGFDGRSDRGLAVGCDAHAPRGRRPRIELRPPEGSAVRKLMRVVVVQLDPVGGAVVHIQIDEAGGDRFELALADHRQNVDQAEIDRIVGER